MDFINKILSLITALILIVIDVVGVVVGGLITTIVTLLFGGTIGLFGCLALIVVGSCLLSLLVALI